MKTFKYLIVAAAFMSASSFAQAADLPLRGPVPQPMAMAPAPMQEDYSGLYLRGDVGVGISNFNQISRNAPQLTSFKSEYNEISSNAHIGAGIGYAWNSWLRTDLTLELRGAGQHVNGRYSYTSGGGSGYNDYKANLNQVVGLVNAYIDLGTFAGITPYIGAGIGFAHNRMGYTSMPGSYGCGGCITPTNEVVSPGAKTNLAWALMAGVSYDVSRNAKLELGYRYLNSGSFTSGNQSTDACGCTFTSVPLTGGKITSHDFRLGMRWQLAGGPAPVQAPLMRRF
jgi:opacity protein-like surface antigen